MNPRHEGSQGTARSTTHLCMHPLPGFRDARFGVRPARPRIARSVFLALALVFFHATHAGRAVAQQTDPNLWVANGEVDALAHHGNTLYLGGAFDCVGPVTGDAVPVSATTGVAHRDFRTSTVRFGGGGTAAAAGSSAAPSPVWAASALRSRADRERLHQTSWNPAPDGGVQTCCATAPRCT
jgi:hypothetical protein